MVFNKLTLMALVAFVALNAMADDDKHPGEISDWCPPCKRVIDDFTPALKTTHVQETYERLCNDIYQEDKDTNEMCTNLYDSLYTGIRNSLNAGKSAEEVCTDLGACQKSSSQQRQKFVSFQKHHERFRQQFSKLF